MYRTSPPHKIWVTKNMSTIIWIIIILLSTIFEIVISEESIDPLHGLADQISRDYAPNQVTIFVNKAESSDGSISYHQNIAMKKIVQMNPSAIINVAQFDIADFNRTITYYSIQLNPRQVSIYVILLDDRSRSPFLESVSQFLRFFDGMNHKAIRPKILLVYFSNESDDEEVIQAFFEVTKIAWHYQFLDFSILQLNPKSDNDSYLYHYNPFFNSFIKSLYNTGDALFVDKLRDVNLYPIRVMLTNQPPYLQFFIEKGKLSIQGLHIQLLKIASQKMNFKINYFPSNSSSLSHTSVNKDSLNHLKQGHVDILGVALSFVQSKCAKISLGLIYYEGFVAMVPILTYTISFYIPVNILVYLFLIPAVTISLVRLSVYLRILSINPGVFNVVQVFYGVPTNQPRKSVDRIIFLSLVFISMEYSMYYYSRLLDGQILGQEMSFASLRDIADSPMDIFINRKYVDRYLPIEDPDIRRIKARITPLDDITECLEKFGTRSVICIASEYYSKYMEETRLDSKGRRLIKVAPVVFSKELLVFYTKNAFPFTEKFQNIFQRIYEAGIWPSPFIDGQKMMINNETKGIKGVNQKEGLMIYQIGLMLTAGFSMALLAFAWEMLL